eukprot:11316878-Alexandrium_andersonii.AAC.1
MHAPCVRKVAICRSTSVETRARHLRARASKSWAASNLTERRRPWRGRREVPTLPSVAVQA